MDHSNTEKETASSLHRQWQLLSRLSTGKWTGTRQLQEQLQREGIEISLRTIQRDLKQLSQRFPLEANGEVPQGWRWKADAPVQSLPHMNSSQAITFMMVEEHLRHLLPPSLLAEMRPWFDLAQRSLSVENNHMREWIKRVRIIPPTQPLIPPAVNPAAQQAIYEALLQDRQLQAGYHRRGQPDLTKTYQLNPLALVQRGPIIYLLCTRCDQPNSDIRMFALHRFTEAKVLEQRAERPADFDLDDYLASGALGFKTASLISQDQRLTPIQLRFSATAGQGLLECRLSEDQQTTTETDGSIMVEASLPLTAQLVWWLRGFGQDVEVLAPDELANAVSDSAAF
ncbi:MAG: WYL domain-containing protein [Pseudomonadota bacterium]|nr:WYL domain-containing protein [Pseudomonadota bacterium]